MMFVVRSALMMSLMASASPLAAQTALSDRPGMWISIEPGAVDGAAPVLSAPEAAPLITTDVAPSDVVLDATAGETGVILSHPSIAENATILPPAPTRRPTPRPRDLELAGPVEREAPSDQVAAIMVDSSFAGPRPWQRPRDVPDIAVSTIAAAVLDALATDDASEVAIAENAQVEMQSVEVADAAALAAELAAELAGDAHDIMAAAQRPEEPEATLNGVDVADSIVVASAARATPQPPSLAPTPNVVQAVARMSPRNQPASLSAVLLPNALSNARPAVQPAVFLAPREDRAPVLSRPLPEGPAAQEGIPAPLPVAAVALSAVLMPGESPAPDRMGRLSFAAQPMPDMFPYSALPPGELPIGPDALARAVLPPMPAPESMAAVLLTEPRPAPTPLNPLAFPDMPLAGEPPRDPDAAPELPAPDIAALERMIADAAICWQFADLSPEAGWARLSVDVALDEMNMPTTQSIRLTGFAHVMSSSAAEAYGAARGALVGCAEATGSAPATTPATLVFDRSGVRLR